jgi:hypothetical protein
MVKAKALVSDLALALHLMKLGEPILPKIYNTQKM